MKPYSYSQISRYLNCPLSYYKKHVQGIPLPDSMALRVGKTSHSFAEQYSRRCLDTKKFTDVEFGMKLRDELLIELKAEEIEDFIDIANKFMETHLFDTRDGSLQRLIEEKFAFDDRWKPCDWDSKKAKFRAIIDFAKVFAETVSIVDYKTNRRIKPKSEVENDLQLKIYAFICSMTNKRLQAFRVALDFIRYGVKVEAEVDAEQIKRIGSFLDRLIDKIEAEKQWEPQLGSHCEYCGYTNSCKLFQMSPLSDIVAMDMNQAAKAAEWLFVNKIRVGHVEKALKEWIEKNDTNIMIGDLDLGFHLREKKQIKSVRDAYDKLIEIGIFEDKIWDQLTLSKSSVERLLRKHKKREMIPFFLKEHFEDKGESHFKFEKT